MKIGLVGNMNNIFFTMLRYFRDLGLDAYLILYQNEQPQFLPDKATWDQAKWSDYIIQSDLVNGIEKNNFGFFRVSKKYIRNLLSDYDIILGNGIAPIYCRRAGIKLDYYLPYGVGVEFLRIRNDNLLRLVSSTYLKYLQTKSIRHDVKACITWEKASIEPFEKLNKEIIRLGYPMVYVEKGISLPSKIQSLWEKVEHSDFKVVSHASHIWKNVPSNWTHSWIRNEWVIEAFANYLRKSSSAKPILILFEYGPDVSESKKLIRELGIEESIVWFPMLMQKEIILLLDRADVGIGKVGGNDIWGGVGWEFLSAGVPFLWNLRLTKDEYSEITGNPIPNFYNVKSIEDIENALLSLEESRSQREEIEKKNKEWFDSYGGIGLANKYVELFEKSV